jgi:predicted nuclease of predicted toxin-antitoxin system
MMRILLDENVPRRLKQIFPGFMVATVGEMGWTGSRNGELLKLAENSFDVLITVAKGIQHQNSLDSKSIALITLVVQWNKPRYLFPLIPLILQAIADLQPGQSINIS